MKKRIKNSGLTITKWEQSKIDNIFENLNALALDKNFQSKLQKAYSSKVDWDEIDDDDAIWVLSNFLENIVDTAKNSFRDTSDWED